MSSFQLQNAEVLARLKPFGISFEKSLSDLIKGIRSQSKESPESLSAFLDAAILECKNELTTTDLETKAMAVLKLAYLEMYGFDMTWCNFQILEVMSSTNFQQKRIGYLAAVQSFKNEQDLLILATNQIKKDLNSHNHTEVGLALSGIATIVTPNLSKDINDDVLMKLNHSSPYIRKKAILAMYKVFLQYPDSLRINFNRVIEKLDDPDIAVVSATINVICEISKKNPNIFVSYLPKFFSILEETENNWLIIRILKLFQSLSKVEPRMKKKILPIILAMMMKTEASSLKYECISCIINGSMLSADSSKDKDVAKKCIEQLMTFFKTRDSNLKFVGLLALINIIKLFPGLMHKVKGVSAVVMDCLTDNDSIIKRKALEVCHFLVMEDNIVELMKVLLLQLVPNEQVVIPEALKSEISAKILQIASKDNYSNVPNFEWYVAVLKDLINLTLLPLPSTTNATISVKTSNVIARRIGDELKTLASKVPSIRPSIMNKVIFESLQNVKILDNCPLILKDFYWIMGEYIDELKPIDSSDSEDDDDDDDERDDHGNAAAVYLGKKIQLLNTFVNFHVDTSLHISHKPNFPISHKLINLPQVDVLIVLVQALVKLFNGIVNDYMSLYATENGTKLPHAKLNEVRFYLLKLINYLGNWENHSNFEVQERTLSWLEFLKLVLEALSQGGLREVDALQKEEISYYSKLAKDRDDDDDDSEGEQSEEEDDDDSESGEDDEDHHDVGRENDYESVESSSSEEEEDGEEDDDDDANDANDRTAKQDSITSQTDGIPLDVSGSVFKSNISVNEVGDQVSNSPLSASEPEHLPILLTHILPSFFKSYPLNPISHNAQRKIGVPSDLDLDMPINDPPIINLSTDDEESEFSDAESIVSQTDAATGDEPALVRSDSSEVLRKQERLERLKDDPYYLTSDTGGKTKTKNKSKKSKKLLTSIDDDGEAGDSKPSAQASERNSINSTDRQKNAKGKKPRKESKPKKTLKKDRVVILSEETIGGPDQDEEENRSLAKEQAKKKRNALKIDSSNLDNFDLNSEAAGGAGFDDANGKDFEYNIDLDAWRDKLAQDELKKQQKEEKKKKKKSHAKSKSEGDDDENDGKKSAKSKSKKADPESSVGRDDQSKSLTPTDDLESKVINVKPKKKTKKKAAKILD